MAELKDIAKINTDNLKKVRNDLGITQKFLSACLGYKSNYKIGQWEREAVEIPDEDRKKLIEVVSTLRYLQAGYKMKATPEGDESERRRREVKESIRSFLDIMEMPSNDKVKKRLMQSLVQDTIKQIDKIL